MKLEPRVILKLFLNFSNFEPQYSNKNHAYKKRVQCMVELDKPIAISAHKCLSPSVENVCLQKEVLQTAEISDIFYSCLSVLKATLVFSQIFYCLQVLVAHVKFSFCNYQISFSEQNRSEQIRLSL